MTKHHKAPPVHNDHVAEGSEKFTDAEVAANNQAAALSTSPLDAAAVNQSGATLGALSAASAVVESATHGTSDVGNALAGAGSVGGNSDTLDQAAGTKDVSDDELLDRLSNAVKDDMLSRQAGDLNGERSMLAAIKGFKVAFKAKYDHLLTGMANSTAEALRSLADAEIHLADHIAQQDQPKEGV